MTKFHLSRLEDFVGRFPGWAGLLVETRRRATGLEHTVEVLSDRMTHDPFLSTSLHEVISTVTAIRATAGILVETQDIDPAKIIRRINYHHPVFQPGRDSAQSRHHKMIRRQGISYCGAYWGYGFHEDGVRSALAVAEAYDEVLAA